MKEQIKTGFKDITNNEFAMVLLLQVQNKNSTLGSGKGVPASFPQIKKKVFCMNILTRVTLAQFQVEKEKIQEHERACSYEHLNLLLHFIMGIKVSVESLQPQGLELASHKLDMLQQSLCELEVKLGQLSAGAPVQGPCVPCLPVPNPPPPVPPTPTLATSFTPLPSAVGAALELQLHSEKTKVAELSRRCQDLELKASTFENIVCVLNREMERSATTMEAYNRQHRLDQDKIEILNNKVMKCFEKKTVKSRNLVKDK